MAIVYGFMYIAMEVCFRAALGRTHDVNAVAYGYASLMGWTSVWMFPIGALCGMTLGLIDELWTATRRAPYYQMRVVLGMIAIYCIEFGSGIVFNLWLGLNLWSYQDRLNVFGQITLAYLPVWLIMSVFGQWFDELLRYIFLAKTWPGSFVLALAEVFGIRN